MKRRENVGALKIARIGVPVMSMVPVMVPILALVLFMTAGFSSCISSGKERAMELRSRTVKEVDLQRYSGLWYEIARFPHRFEKGLVGVTAEYILKDNGRITVINRGYRGSFDGPVSSIKGRAWVPSRARPGRIKVAFFLFFGADYLIFDLDREAPDYRYAIVGSSSDNYLWILGREPFMDETLYRSLVEKAASLGYDTSRLIRVPQREADPDLLSEERRFEITGGIGPDPDRRGR